MKDSLRSLATGPSAWLVRFHSWFAPGAQVLEIACGLGRNTWYLSHLDVKVTACDITPPPEVPENVTFVQHDLEGDVWPFAPDSFDAVVGINYLYRPHFADLLSCVRPGGFVLYETFSDLQGHFKARPRNPEHLLRAGELISLLPAGWRIAAYEDGLTEFGQYLQRIAAVRCHPGVICAPSVCAPR